MGGGAARARRARGVHPRARRTDRADERAGPLRRAVRRAAVALRAPPAADPPARDRRERGVEPQRAPLPLRRRRCAARRRVEPARVRPSRGAERRSPTPSRRRGGWRSPSGRGCDQAPIDPASQEGRLALRSYIWPDEPERLARVAQAAAVAAQHPVAIEQCSAAAWLAIRLARVRPDLLTVVWQSVVNQYLEDGERAAIRSAFASAGAGPLAWLTLEPPPAGSDVGSFELRCRERPEDNGSGEARLLAHAGYHGPPVVWRVSGA